MPALSAAEIAPMPYVREIRAAWLKVRADRKRMAVDELELALGTGIHGLLGPNGAGKSTLNRTVATVMQTSLGRTETDTAACWT
ncbi:ATP-binding cassette domain-containing protein [Streptomyces yaanensis]|uniref:ATP-binding cassette domain-containing protein n=1 Tax=Streptomyces yaanensis TaxID=1142239 RepID=A0ABV7SD48_9ACTN